MKAKEHLPRRPPSWVRFLQVGLGVIAKKESKTIVTAMKMIKLINTS